LLASVRPAVLALFIFAGWQIAAVSIRDIPSLLIFVVIAGVSRLYKKSPIFYILLSAGIGMICRL
jgi:chromate transport protein ChrA